ncbi:hypothetical protein ACIHCV_02460 [Streptomyces sp. NPDC051956]|uniref:hypothetical protein n=1 Tax=Streptomyces sp. NPDC051956 TaxID=3365677 RepID=UPI0037CFA06C
MMGIDPLRQRAMMAEALDAIVRLVRAETVTERTDWYELADARLQLGPYRPEGLDRAVASTVSASGSVQAGRHGIGLLSLAAADPAGLTAPAALGPHREGRARPVDVRGLPGLRGRHHRHPGRRPGPDRGAHRGLRRRAVRRGDAQRKVGAADAGGERLGNRGAGEVR